MAEEAHSMVEERHLNVTKDNRLDVTRNVHVKSCMVSKSICFGKEISVRMLLYCTYTRAFTCINRK
jgi:hypothetical protein